MAMLKANQVIFEYEQVFETKKVNKKTKPAGGHKDEDGELSEASKDVSSEEQGPFGDLPSAIGDIEPHLHEIEK